MSELEPLKLILEYGDSSPLFPAATRRGDVWPHLIAANRIREWS